MDINEYQQQCLTTANYPNIGHRCIYPALNLASEAGEILGKIKKVFRDDDGYFSTQKLEAIKDECGDTLWCLATLAHDLGFTLDEVASRNLEKLKSRKERNTINGDGDYR